MSGGASGRTISLQPAPRTDHITEDGAELTQLPYPFHVRADTGQVQQRIFDGWRIVGFQRDLAQQQVDLWWVDYTQGDPQVAVGMYVITEDAEGAWSTHVTAIESVTVKE